MALDIDVLLAAQVLRLDRPALVATTNPKHLAQFVPAQFWTEIAPSMFAQR
jgi:hypothetical protein